MVCAVVYHFFFFKQKTAYEMRISDWSSDVCSSDLQREPPDDFGLSRLQVVERRHVGLRHEQHVHRRLRGDIAERDDVVVFVDDVGRDLAADDLVDVGHGSDGIEGNEGIAGSCATEVEWGSGLRCEWRRLGEVWGSSFYVGWS